MERDESGTIIGMTLADEPADGIKHDTGKDPWELLPYDALRQVVKVLAFGARKYEARNWEKGIAYGRLMGAVMRHLTDWWAGEEKDPETGLHPLAHVACDALFLLTYELRGKKDRDDRPRGV